MAKTKVERGTLTEVISMRLAEDDAARLARLAERVPIARLTIARLAMRIGLEALEKNPERLLSPRSRQ